MSLIEPATLEEVVQINNKIPEFIHLNKEHFEQRLRNKEKLIIVGYVKSADCYFYRLPNRKIYK